MLRLRQRHAVHLLPIPVLHRAPVELRLTLHGHGFEQVQLIGLVLHRALSVDELDLLVEKRCLLLLLVLLHQGLLLLLAALV